MYKRWFNERAQDDDIAFAVLNDNGVVVMIRKYILLAFLIIPLLSYAQVDSTENIITFRVISKPTSYAAKIHITGNHPLLSNWRWPYIPLEERSDGVWEKTFSFATGTRLQYALNLGRWECVGLDSSGVILGDSIFWAGKTYQYSPSFLEVKNDTTVTSLLWPALDAIALFRSLKMIRRPNDLFG